MESLDSLLDDLGKGNQIGSRSSTQGVKTNPRPESKRVDLNELEILMEDLSRPDPEKPKHEKIAPQQVQTVAPTPPKSQQAISAKNVDDLDELLKSLSDARPQPRQTTPLPEPTKPPVTQQPQKPVQTPEPPKPKVEPPKPQPVVEPPKYVQTPEPPKPVVEPPKPVVQQNDDLDKLLNNLTSQMNTIDSENPSSRGTCFTCRQSILGEIIQAMGRTYHPEHFICTNCRDPLGTRPFFESKSNIYCEKCFQELHCNPCGHCSKPVVDRAITALGKSWHVEHFICTQCLKPFPGGTFFERDGRPYCESDFYSLFAPKCMGCNEAIKGDCINALGSQWHPEHFACSHCGKSFVGGTFFEFNGRPYCETHYYQQSGALCSGCGKPITGRCVNALDKKWHPEHFVCAFCMNPLAGGSFTEHKSKAYCKECHTKLFSSSS